MTEHYELHQLIGGKGEWLNSVSPEGYVYPI